MLYDDVGEHRFHGRPPRLSLLAWSALLAVATLLTPFTVWAIVRMAGLLAG
jgi:hypothetical protein